MCVQVENITNALIQQKKKYMKQRLEDSLERRRSIDSESTHHHNFSWVEDLYQGDWNRQLENHSRAPLKQVNNVAESLKPEYRARMSPTRKVETTSISDLATYKKYAEMERKLGTYLLDLQKEERVLENQYGYLNNINVPQSS